jgi:tricorn protease interacting factor F2/3
MNAFNLTNYRITLTPDLERFTFTGRVEITGESRSELNEITLNILELTIDRCLIRLGADSFNCPFDADPEKEVLRIQLPRKVSGDISITIDYDGFINDKMAGFYRSSYELEGETHYVAVTQFQESDARRAFPCIDHPLNKATFDIEMIIDDHLSAISNTVITNEEPVNAGKKRVRFQQTPKMSTYLLFFGVGDFKFLTDEIDKRVRAATIPGRLAYAHFGLAFGRQALAFCEDYYRIAYPLPKMDLIAIPDFAFGAMENWGAITFRENLLLHYPEITSRSGEERICEVIAHEIAHQWFGNLVTPSDWRYLWLNESFATFFGFGVVDHYHPQWGIWQQFLGGQTAAAMTRDGLHETFAIEIPGGEHVVINTSTAPIIYSKGGSILRQIQGYIGKENFRDGLTHYLKKHAYGNAASHHLWEAFETVAEKPITKMMKSWIEQPGFPVVDVHRKGQTLHLSQQRFTYLPNSFDQCWDIPVNIRLYDSGGNEKTIQTLLEQQHATVSLDSHTAAYKINDGQTGFYRVRYTDGDDLDALGPYILSGALLPEDRWGLQNDLFARVRCGDSPLEDYLAFLDHYRKEDAYLPLADITGNLFQAYLIVGNESKRQLVATGMELLQNALAAIGFEPVAGEDFTTSLLYPAVLFGVGEAVEYAGDAFEVFRDGQPVHADILKSVLQISALSGGQEVFELYKERFQSSESEHERMNILAAFGCFRDPDLIEQALQYALDEVPDRNKFIPIVAMSSNPYALDYLWDWYVAHIRDFEQFHPLLYERIIAGIVPVSGIEKSDQVSAFFQDYTREHPHTGDVVKLSLEKLAINIGMREREQGAI